MTHSNRYQIVTVGSITVRPATGKRGRTRSPASPPCGHSLPLAHHISALDEHTAQYAASVTTLTAGRFLY